MSLLHVNGIFSGASVNNSDLIIPSGSITSFTPSDGTTPGGVEMIYGLLESMSAAIIADAADPNPTTTRLTATASSRLNGGLLRRSYTFTVDLAFSDDLLADLNVAAEPA